MAIILDTNVASELVDDRQQLEVLDWWRRQAIEEAYVTAITEIELRYGVAIMPEGRNRARLSRQIDDLLEIDFAGRILPFDSAAAYTYAVIASRRRAVGRVVGQSDTQIAAIALSLGMTVATRNVRHFTDCGIELITPGQPKERSNNAYLRLVTRTLRDDPPEAETASHRLMLRAGLIQQVAAGIYAYLPLAWRSMQKIEQIVREEMDAAGSQELRMPALQPMELWEQTGRAAAFGDNMFSLEDRRGRPLALAPTHEEVVTNIVKGNVQSYRDLPVILYQMQTKFRDEPRPRAGLVRVREFTMKDAYSFDADDDGLDVSYQAMAQAYRNVFRRCSIPVVMAEADSGAIGGKDSHEFLLPTDTGEDTVITCPSCGYAANAEKAAGVYPDQPVPAPLPLEEVSTPGMKTIASLCEFLGVAEAQTLKAVFYAADGEVVFVTIRGDLEVNEVKLKNALHCNDLRLAEDDEVAAAGIVAGSASAIGISNIRRIADDSITNGGNFVVGANKPDTHYRNTNYPRDFDADLVTDIALTEPGHLCAQCGAALQFTRGVEVRPHLQAGHFFQRIFGSFLSGLRWRAAAHHHGLLRHRRQPDPGRRD